MIRILLLLGCIILAPTGNLLLKWGMNECGSITETNMGVARYYLDVLSKPQVLVGTGVYIASALLWLAVLGMMDLSAAYPIFVSGAFLIVTVAAVLLFQEHVNWVRIVGILVVVLGIFIVSQSARWYESRPAAAPIGLSSKMQDGNDGHTVQQNIDQQR